MLFQTLTYTYSISGKPTFSLILQMNQFDGWSILKIQSILSFHLGTTKPTNMHGLSAAGSLCIYYTSWWYIPLRDNQIIYYAIQCYNSKYSSVKYCVASLTKQVIMRISFKAGTCYNNARGFLFVFFPGKDLHHNLENLYTLTLRPKYT